MKAKNLFNIYKKTIQKNAVDLCFSAFERANNIKTFENIFETAKKVFTSADISDNQECFDPNKLPSIKSICNDNYALFLLNYLMYMKRTYVHSSSIEFRIGKALMSSIGLRKYK